MKNYFVQSDMAELEMRVLSRFPDEVLDVLASCTTKGEIGLAELDMRLAMKGWRLGNLSQLEHILKDAGFSIRVDPLAPLQISRNIVSL